jgi:hypothetical protein
MKMRREKANFSIKYFNSVKIGWLSYGILFLFSVFISACIKPYEAEIDEVANLISIEGSIIKGESVQTVTISRTSPLIYPQYKPIRDCDVKVIDELDNEFLFNQNLDVTYSAEIPDEELVFGRQYKIQITTPSGEQYESQFETLNTGTDVDSVYYEIKESTDNLSNEELFGLQFYVDLEAADTVSRYFRWKLEETYEYTSSAPISYYYEDAGLTPVHLDNPNEFFRCWKTELVPGLYLSSTVTLTANEKKKIPLHYVSTISDRLKIKYSLFVKQYTLNEGAYNYWQKNKIATEESGGIYTQQPGQPITNLRNVNDSSEQVLGYFWISNMKKQRIFVPRINSLPVIGEVCELAEFNLADHGEGPFPRYIYEDIRTDQNLTGSAFCFICTLKGGTVVKPEFWDE